MLPPKGQTPFRTGTERLILAGQVTNSKQSRALLTVWADRIRQMRPTFTEPSSGLTEPSSGLTEPSSGLTEPLEGGGASLTKYDFVLYVFDFFADQLEFEVALIALVLQDSQNLLEWHTAMA